MMSRPIRQSRIAEGGCEGRDPTRPAARLRWIAPALLISALLLGASPVAAATISIVPDFDRLEPNRTLTLDILIDDIDATTAVGGVDLRIVFDPTRVAFESAQLGTGLAVGGFPSLGSTTASANEVRIVELALAPSDVLIASQPSGFSLARIEFRTLTLGLASFSLAPTSLVSDPFGAALEIDGASFAVVEVVPEPGAAMLFAVGLLVASRATGRRRLRNAT